MKEIYLDHAATTKLDEQVLNEMLPYLRNEYGNPSSIYTKGRTAKKTIDFVRKQIADGIGCNPREIYFTSGGSESDNMALKGIVYQSKEKGNHIITSCIEHPAILETCKELEKEGFLVTYVEVEENGIIDPKKIENAITKDTILISIMYANNEIGTIQPIKQIGEIAKKNHIIFHTDAVQAIGNIKINVEDLNIDALSLSAHKFYGPKGIGALYVNEKVSFQKLITGGHQEQNKRAGTQNVAGIVGLGKALEATYKDLEDKNKYIQSLRDYYIKRIKEEISDIKINGDLINRLPGNANISFRYMDANEMILGLDMNQIYASSRECMQLRFIRPFSCFKSIECTRRIYKRNIKDNDW